LTGLTGSPGAALRGTQVGCDLVLDVATPATIVLSVAPATGAGTLDIDRFEITCDGLPFEPRPRRLPSAHGAVLHVLDLPQGHIDLRYDAHVTGRATPAAAPADEVELLTYRRPSRFCPSDRLGGFASAELEHLPEGSSRLDGLVVWVARRLAYVVGSSGPLDTAVETLLAGQGVCRDYAHLVVAMARALDMPARCVSVYAPGLSPMDFHAVAEVHVDGRWNVFDATYLAPRQSLVRIATGRDAADTAFLTTTRGDVELVDVVVRASVDGDLPRDSFSEPVALA
jgi:transglutaminase-like putative cysteine protease